MFQKKIKHDTNMECTRNRDFRVIASAQIPPLVTVNEHEHKLGIKTQHNNKNTSDSWLEDVPLPRQLVVGVTDPGEWKSVAEQVYRGDDLELWDRRHNQHLNGKGLFRWEVNLSRCMVKQEGGGCQQCVELRRELEECREELQFMQESDPEGLLETSLRNKIVEMNDEREYALRKLDRVNKKMDRLKENYERAQSLINDMKKAVKRADTDEAVKSIRTALDLPPKVLEQTNAALDTLEKELDESRDELPDKKEEVEHIQDAVKELKKKETIKRSDLENLEKKIHDVGLGAKLATGVATVLGTFLAESAKGTMKAVLPVAGEVTGKGLLGVAKRVGKMINPVDDDKVNRYIEEYRNEMKDYSPKERQVWLSARQSMQGDVESEKAIEILTEQGWWKPPTKGAPSVLTKSELKKTLEEFSKQFSDSQPDVRVQQQPVRQQPVQVERQQPGMYYPSDSGAVEAKVKAEAENASLKAANAVLTTERTNLKETVARLNAENGELKIKVTKLESTEGLNQKIVELGARVGCDSEKDVLKARIVELENRAVVPGPPSDANKTLTELVKDLQARNLVLSGELESIKRKGNVSTSGLLDLDKQRIADFERRLLEIPSVPQGQGLVEDLKRTHSELLTNNRSLLDELERCRKHNYEVMTTSTELMSANAVLKSKLDAVGDNSELRSQLDTEVSKNRTLRSQLEGVQRELERTVESEPGSIKRQGSELSDLEKQRIADFERRLLAIPSVPQGQGLVEDLKRTHSELLTKNRSLNDELERCRKHNDEVMKTNTELMSANAVLKSKLDAVGDNSDLRSQLDTEVSTLRSQLEGVQRELDRKLETESEWKLKLAAQVNKNSELDDALTGLRKNREELEEELRQAFRNNQNTERKYGEILKKQQETEKMAESSEASLTSFQRMSEANEASRRDMEARLVTMNQQAADAEAALKNCIANARMSNARADNAEQELKKCRTEVELLKQDLERAQAMLQQKNEQIQAEEEKWREENARQQQAYQAELQAHNERVAELQNTINVCTQVRDEAFRERTLQAEQDKAALQAAQQETQRLIQQAREAEQQETQHQAELDAAQESQREVQQEAERAAAEQAAQHRAELDAARESAQRKVQEEAERAAQRVRQQAAEQAAQHQAELDAAQQEAQEAAAFMEAAQKQAQDAEARSEAQVAQVIQDMDLRNAEVYNRILPERVVRSGSRFGNKCKEYMDVILKEFQGTDAETQEIQNFRDNFCNNTISEIPEAFMLKLNDIENRTNSASVKNAITNFIRMVNNNRIPITGQASALEVRGKKRRLGGGSTLSDAFKNGVHLRPLPHDTYQFKFKPNVDVMELVWARSPESMNFLDGLDVVVVKHKLPTDPDYISDRMVTIPCRKRVGGEWVPVDMMMHFL